MKAALIVVSVGLALGSAGMAMADQSEHTLITKKQLKRSKTLCEKTWPAKKNPTRAQTDLCLQYWLFTYNYDRPETLAGVEDALSLDPSPRGGAKYKAATFRAMSAHVNRAYPKSGGWLVSRAVEFFDGSANSYVSFFDMNFDFEGGLKTVLAGKALSGELEGATSATLWRLRNAAYARHGRKFKHPDLNHFFYGKWKRPKSMAGVLPLEVNAKFKDSMLTKTDRKNVRAIRAAEKAR